MRGTMFLCLTAVLVALSCGDSNDSPGGSGAGGSGAAGMTGGGSGGAAGASPTCAPTRADFAAAIASATACTTDDDCKDYYAPCLQEEAGNCAGIFYVAKSGLSSIASARAAHDTCLGHACDTGMTCLLGALQPACVDGVCGHR